MVTLYLGDIVALVILIAIGFGVYKATLYYTDKNND